MDPDVWFCADTAVSLHRNHAITFVNANICWQKEAEIKKQTNYTLKNIQRDNVPDHGDQERLSGNIGA